MATEEVNKPPSLPQYSEMIFAAIAALDDKNGSSKSAISKYIESQYGNLPAGHSQLLSHHLNRLKESGELIMVKNNYIKPNPNDPPKGRPPKPKDPSAPVVPKVSSGTGRPRGRPPKKARPAGAATAASGPPRPRGRPPKAKPPFAAVSV
uniref:H15 domain-containing protein n=1 Tax=Nelumbo nucifera TaxID=4432 RepID=A0A822YUE6_NELNU|nr:TPA_asm: hypothetical protein HUJ06_006363 [Nelumbo nucifera]